MSTNQYRGGATSLEDIRAGLENPDLTMTQRKHAFKDLRHWLADHPDDETARELLARHEAEFGRESAASAERATSGEGFAAIGEAERRVEAESGRAGRRSQ